MIVMSSDDLSTRSSQPKYLILSKLDDLVIELGLLKDLQKV